jgi:NhaP-type Na+/H+ or K+/H+ antiporter
MDWSAFTKATVAGIPLLFVVLGLVEWLKKFNKPDGTPKFDGNVILLLSLGLGLLFGGGYMITVTRPPILDLWEIYVYWFAVVVYGLAMGLVASGLYDAVKTMIEKIFTKANLDG